MVRTVCKDFFAIITNYYENKSLLYSVYLKKIEKLCIEFASKNDLENLDSLLQRRENLGHFGCSLYSRIIDTSIKHNHLRILLYIMSSRDIYHTIKNFETAIENSRIEFIEHMDEYNLKKNHRGFEFIDSYIITKKLTRKMTNYLESRKILWHRCYENHNIDDDDNIDHDIDDDNADHGINDKTAAILMVILIIVMPIIIYLYYH